jgi:hypothetical protein
VESIGCTISANKLWYLLVFRYDCRIHLRLHTEAHTINVLKKSESPKNPAMPGDQRKGDDDPHHKSNNKRASKETKNSKRPVKQECADQQRAGHAPLDASAVQNPAGRSGDDTGARPCGDKNGCKASPANTRDYTRGVLVWHRIKGFPWWPGIVVNESDVPITQRKVGVGQVESIPRLALGHYDFLYFLFMAYDSKCIQPLDHTHRDLLNNTMNCGCSP